MRRLVYSVAKSLDGFIAGPKGEHDWISRDSGIDFVALYSRFDILLLGRRTFDVASTQRKMLEDTGMTVVVVSTTLDPAEHTGISVLKSDIAAAIRTLKSETGKDIWLMGGGVLFRNLVDLGLVDEVILSVFQVMLGAGVPLLPEGCRVKFRLNDSNALPSGVLMLNYSVKQSP